MTALLTDNLPLLAGAPNGIRKLRELILELAVRGKLVPQDPSDEPASELLKRIVEEKTRLVAAGKIKRSKPPADISELDKPYELPAGWSWTTLPGAARYQIGKTPPTKESKFWGDSGQPWVSISDMEHYGEIYDTARKVSALAQHDVFKCPPVPAGTLLMSFKLTVGKVAKLAVDAYHNEAIISLSPFSGVSKDFLFRFLPSIALGGQQKNALMGNTLNSESLAQLLVPIPPLAEQHRIVAKVDELMALCDRLEARQADADSAHAQLVQALFDSLTRARDAEDFAQSWQRLAEHFQTLFTTESSIDALKQTLLQLAVMGKLVPQTPSDDPASELLKKIDRERNQLVSQKVIRKGKPLPDIEEHEMQFELPVGWEWVRLGQIGDWGAGATPARGNSNYYGGKMPWFKSGELVADLISDSEEKVTDLALKECSLRRNRSGDVLIAMYGATIGKAAILSVEGTTNQAVCACTPFNGVFNRYLLLTIKVLRSNFIRQGAGGAQPNISREKIIATVTGLPPSLEQHRIVAKVDQLMALCDQLKTRLNQARQVHEQLASALVEQAVA